MILLLDNNDSFSYNVLQLLQQATDSPVVIGRKENLVIEDVEQFDHIVFSPGPGLPDEFAMMREILRRYDTTKPILGICLGHQAICQYYGARLVNLEQVYHGVSSQIACDRQSRLFRGVEQMVVGRYHSWAVDSIPDELKITATDDCGVVMAVEHRTKPIYGVQFHPESYITKGGRMIVEKFLNGIS